MKHIKLESESVSSFEGSVDSIIDKLKGIKKKYEGDGYTNIRIEFEDQWGYYDEHWIDAVFYGEKVEKPVKNVKRVYEKNMKQ